MTTDASLAHPTNHATGSGFRNGIGAIPFHPFCVTASLGSVLVWGHRGNVLHLLQMIGGGFDCIPLGPPFPV